MQGHGMVTATYPSRTAPDVRRIAIVGGGFSGTAVAIQLLRQRTRERIEVLLLEPQPDPGAGVAFAARDYPYPLNVAAGQMSLDTAQPDDFLEFVRAQGIHAAADDYLPRQVYGDYLRTRFAESCAAAPQNLRAIHLRARVLQVRRDAAGGWDLWLDDGSSRHAHEVVLALGNAPPRKWRELAPIATSRHYLEDPWSIGACAHEGVDSVLLLGSGLTMIDVALRMAAVRPRAANIHVLSRHGLLPLSQSNGAQPVPKPDLSALPAVRGSLRGVLRTLRALVREHAAAGGDWRTVIVGLRPQLPAIWQELDAAQRAQFLRHLRAIWDAHRHRVPAGPLAAVRSLERLGVLQVHAGRIESLRLVEDAVEVQWLPRGAQRARAWLVDRVVNCTGPDSGVTRHADPLVQSLLAGGLLRPDALGLGIEVAADGRVISSTGSAVDSLYYIGPWLRARDWEATAVPELREHAARLARRLAGHEARARRT